LIELDLEALNSMRIVKQLRLCRWARRCSMGDGLLYWTVQIGGRDSWRAAAVVLVGLKDIGSCDTGISAWR